MGFLTEISERVPFTQLPDETKQPEDPGSPDSEPPSIESLSPERPDRRSERMFAFHRTMYRATMLAATGAALLEIIQMPDGNPRHFVLYAVDSCIAFWHFSIRRIYLKETETRRLIDLKGITN